MSVFVQSQHGGTEIANPNGIRGFKAFDPDWACRPRMDIVKQYTCPGVFETETTPSVCWHGMHFCRRLVDIFDYYDTLITTVNGDKEPPKVAEVIAWGIVYEDGNKCSTNKLEIVKEIPWQEVLDRVNMGHSCSGVCNIGNDNTGNWNVGNRNVGSSNVGDDNAGKYNIGDRNTGNWNTSNCNTGNGNTGPCNAGSWNVGPRNTGNWNTGGWNVGDLNVGNNNSGDCNIGNGNLGNGNTGNGNTGSGNTGDWNQTNFSAGCFCTVEPEMLMFNKPSGMTFRQWLMNPAKALLDQIPEITVKWVYKDDMTEEEKEQYPTYKTTGGYLKVSDASESVQHWWDELDHQQQEIILQLPNFDAEIFYLCTNIRV